MIKLEFEGADKLLDAIADSPGNLAKAVKQATRECSQIVKQRAKELAPKKTGALKKGIKFRALKKTELRKGQYGFGVESTTSPFYAHFQEFGWRSRNRHTGRFKGKEKKSPLADRQHARPYLRPALYRNARTLNQLMRERTQAWLRTYSALSAATAGTDKATARQLRLAAARAERAVWNRTKANTELL